MRRIKFLEKEYYHVYNRGTDRRTIFENPHDLNRFIKSIEVLNTIEPIGSVRDKSSNPRGSTSGKKNKPLVELVAYCLNQNHYHFLLSPVVEDGVQKFMHRLSTGYTMYFNDKHKRSGALFQGRYKAVHVEDNEYLLHLSAYINLNDRVHKGLNKAWMKKHTFSSFSQYEKDENEVIKCDTKVILDQFKTRRDYIKYCEKVLPQIIKRKEQERSLQQLTLE